MKRNDAQIGLRLPSDVVEKLRREAEADQRSVSGLVRLLLTDALEDRRDEVVPA